MSDYNDGILPTPCLRMDTHFGDEYESIEFVDGTGYIKAVPILAKAGALHEEIDRLRDESAELREERDMYRDLVGCMVHPDIPDQLQAENEQLRKERDFYFQQVTDNGERAHGAIDALQAENVKLRELCGELYHELYAARDEYWPASYLGDLEPRDVFPRYDELIELGVDA